jgi:hypothetical protein
MTRFWTTRELALVREHYPQGGITACEAVIQRTRSSIYQRAQILGLRAPGRVAVRQHYANDVRLDEALRILHERPLLKGAIVEFAERWNRPAWWISRRARDLGLKTPRFREPPWTAAEVDILHDTGHISPKNARAAFKRAGFNRSETAIVVKRKREGIGVVQSRLDAGLLNGHQVAAMLGVDGKTPSSWIALHGLKATKRWKDGREYDDWVIRERDLREFIITHPCRIELRKIPDSSRAWFIELLAGRAAETVEKAA